MDAVKFLRDFRRMCSSYGSTLYGSTRSLKDCFTLRVHTENAEKCILAM